MGACPKLPSAGDEAPGRGSWKSRTHAWGLSLSVSSAGWYIVGEIKNEKMNDENICGRFLKQKKICIVESLVKRWKTATHERVEIGDMKRVL